MSKKLVVNLISFLIFAWYGNFGDACGGKGCRAVAQMFHYDCYWKERFTHPNPHNQLGTQDKAKAAVKNTSRVGTHIISSFWAFSYSCICLLMSIHLFRNFIQCCCTVLIYIMPCFCSFYIQTSYWCTNKRNKKKRLYAKVIRETSLLYYR